MEVSIARRDTEYWVFYEDLYKPGVCGVFWMAKRCSQTCIEVSVPYTITQNSSNNPTASSQYGGHIRATATPRAYFMPPNAAGLENSNAMCQTPNTYLMNIFIASSLQTCHAIQLFSSRLQRIFSYFNPRSHRMRPP